MFDFHKDIDTKYNTEHVLNDYHMLGVVLSTLYVLTSPLPVIIPIL